MWTDKLGGNGQCPFRLGSSEAGLSIADQREIEGLTTAGFWMTAAIRLAVGWEDQTNLQAHPSSPKSKCLWRNP